MKKGIDTMSIVIYTVILLIVALIGFFLILKGKGVGIMIIDKVKEFFRQR